MLILGKVLVDYRIKCSLTLLKSPFIDIEPRFSVFERRFNVFERTFNVYEWRFYLSINAFFLSWKNCFSRLKFLFYLSFCSNSSVYSEWCKKKRKSFENDLVFKAFSFFLASFFFVLGRTRLRTTPMTAERPILVIESCSVSIVEILS